MNSNYGGGGGGGGSGFGSRDYRQFERNTGNTRGGPGGNRGGGQQQQYSNPGYGAPVFNGAPAALPQYPGSYRAANAGGNYAQANAGGQDWWGQS